MKNSPPSQLLLLSLRQRSSSQCICLLPLYQQRRLKSESQDPERKDKGVDSSPDLNERLRQRIKSGKLGSSIFDTIPGALQKQSQHEEDGEEDNLKRDDAVARRNEPRFSPNDLRPTFKNPIPKAMIRWERKQVIQDVRGRHRLNKNEKLLRSERFHAAKSPMFKTSVKKLGPLARQIAGKTIDEAMVQMRFSKKKAAQDVLKHLKYARDQAVVAKGMGLGKDIGAGIDRPPPNSLEAKLRKDGRVMVEDKDGKKRIVTDRSAMYIDQAFVGRGKYGRKLEYRARGRTNVLHLPYTSISVILKEEATRMRLQEEREQKRQRKPVWVPLPDRPITAQRQYPLW